jgi:ribosomal protein L31
VRLLKLSDGSTLRVGTLVPPAAASQPNGCSVSLLTLDSANHPSWNPALRDRILLDDRGQVAKFRAKYEAAEDTANSAMGSVIDDFERFAEMDPSLGLSSPIPTRSVPKASAQAKQSATRKKK